MPGLEREYLDPVSRSMAMKLVLEYDAHEAEQTRLEAEMCRGCPYYTTCQYSIYTTSAKERKEYNARVGNP